MNAPEHTCDPGPSAEGSRPERTETRVTCPERNLDGPAAINPLIVMNAATKDGIPAGAWPSRCMSVRPFRMRISPASIPSIWLTRARSRDAGFHVSGGHAYCSKDPVWTSAWIPPLLA